MPCMGREERERVYNGTLSDCGRLSYHRGLTGHFHRPVSLYSCTIGQHDFLLIKDIIVSNLELCFKSTPLYDMDGMLPCHQDQIEEN